MTVLFNIFIKQTLTDNCWGLHKNMNCAFPLVLLVCNQLHELMRFRKRKSTQAGRKIFLKIKDLGVLLLIDLSKTFDYLNHKQCVLLFFFLKNKNIFLFSLDFILFYFFNVCCMFVTVSNCSMEIS